MGLRAWCLLLGAATAACAVIPNVLRSKPTVSGEVSFDPLGRARVHECGGTQRTLVVATMADASAYSHLRWRYAEISRDGRDPVLVEVTGIEKLSDTGLMLEEAELLKIKPGLCDVKRATG